MPKVVPSIRVAHCRNERAIRSAPYGERQRRVLNRQAFERARAEITQWSGYAPTPVHDLAGLARAIGVSRIWYKDEGQRFGLGSFKALGGAYAVLRVLLARVEEETGLKGLTGRDLVSGRFAELTSPITVTCATDGNHGRSIAWGAQRFGCDCVVYIHKTVSVERQHAIERLGAQVVRTEGNYDESIRRAAEDAEAHGRIVVSDTSYPGYMEIPRHVMQGYSVMADEAIVQLGAHELPSHVFIPGGVGGFAAAVIAQYWEAYGAKRPRFIAVEPERADCIYASVAAGEPTSIHSDLDTIMAGLACGEVSLLAWEILEGGLDDAMTIPDEAAAECMRLLADGTGDDPAIVAGESAVAGLAGLLGALQRPETAAALELGASSRVLLFGSEGATDPNIYREIVGRPAQEVAGP